MEILFELAWVCGAMSFVFVVIETIGMHGLSPEFFAMGLPVRREVICLPLPRPELSSKGIIRMAEGKFRFPDGRTCLFTSRMHMFRCLRIHTPFPYKATVTWADSGAHLTARIPLGTCLFLAFWLIGWTVGSADAQLLPFLAIGWVFALGIIGLSIPIERARMQWMLSELEQILKDEEDPQIQADVSN